LRPAQYTLAETSVIPIISQRDDEVSVRLNKESDIRGDTEKRNRNTAMRGVLYQLVRRTLFVEEEKKASF
jgi:hypothetical protein